MLKKHELQPQRKRQWCISKITASFWARMEMILRWYSLPSNANFPLICFDECPCFLIGNSVKGLSIKKGKVAKENYAYTKHGSCCVLATIEPKTGKKFGNKEEKKSLLFL